MLAQITLTTAESKKLIVKAIAGLDAVKKAAAEGMVVLHPSSGTYFMVEEITGTKPKTNTWVCGVIAPRGACMEMGILMGKRHDPALATHDPGDFNHSWVIENGKVSVGERLADLLERMTERDVYVKGVNALDANGNVGVLIGNVVEGGTIARVISARKKKPFHLIFPVGLEKLIPGTIEKASKLAKRTQYDYGMGMPVSLWPCSGGQVITELEAIDMLSGATAVPIASGGLGGAEGGVTLVLEGEAGQVKKAIDFIEQSKGAQLPQLRLPICHECPVKQCGFPVIGKSWVMW